MIEPLRLGGIYQEKNTKELYILGVSINGGYILVNLLSGNRDNDYDQTNRVQSIIDSRFEYLGRIESVNIVPNEPVTVKYRI